MKPRYEGELVCKAQCVFWKKKKKWISNIISPVKKTDLNTKSTEIKNYVLSITVLATNAALEGVLLSG